MFNAAKEIEKLNDNKLIQKWKSLLNPHIAELNEEQIAMLKEQKYFWQFVHDVITIEKKFILSKFI